MQPILPTQTGVGSGVQPGPETKAQESGGSAITARTGESSQSSVLSVSTTSSTMVVMSQQVDQFLQSVDPKLGDNQTLKLLIAALIMSALLAEDGGSQQSGQNALQALENLTGGRNNALYLSLETSTQTVRIEQYATRLESVQATQSIEQPQPADEEQTGKQMDLSA